MREIQAFNSHNQTWFDFPDMKTALANARNEPTIWTFFFYDDMGQLIERRWVGDNWRDRVKYGFDVMVDPCRTCLGIPCRCSRSEDRS